MAKKYKEFSEEFSVKVEDMEVNGFKLKRGSQKNEPDNRFSAGELFWNGENILCRVFWNRKNKLPMVSWLATAKKETKAKIVRGDNIAEAVKKPLDELWEDTFGTVQQQAIEQPIQPTQKEPKKTDDEIINDAVSVLANVIDFGDEEIFDDDEPAIQLPNVGRCENNDSKVVIANSKQAITKAEKAGCNAQLISRLRAGIAADKITEVFIEDNVIKVLCGDRLFYGDPITGEVKKYV